MRGGVPRRPGANGQLKPTSRERASPSREPLNEHRHGRDNENRNECVRPNLFARNPKIDVEHMTKNRRDQHRGEHDRQKTPQSKSSWVPHRTVPPEAHPRLVFAKTSDRSRAFACCGTTSQIFAMKAPHLRTVAREGAQPSAVDSVWNKKHRLHGKGCRSLSAFEIRGFFDDCSESVACRALDARHRGHGAACRRRRCPAPAAAPTAFVTSALKRPRRPSASDVVP
jgi:hypothetical protein